MPSLRKSSMAVFADVPGLEVRRSHLELPGIPGLGNPDIFLTENLLLNRIDTSFLPKKKKDPVASSDCASRQTLYVLSPFLDKIRGKEARCISFCIWRRLKMSEGQIYMADTCRS